MSIDHSLSIPNLISFTVAPFNGMCLFFFPLWQSFKIFFRLRYFLWLSRAWLLCEWMWFSLFFFPVGICWTSWIHGLILVFICKIIIHHLSLLLLTHSLSPLFLCYTGFLCLCVPLIHVLNVLFFIFSSLFVSV